MPAAQRLMLARKVDGAVRIPEDFAKRLAAGDATIQVLVNGRDANRARIIEGYVQGRGRRLMARRAAEGFAVESGPVNVQSRLWFNEAKRQPILPGARPDRAGMTLIGALLTAMVVGARVGARLAGGAVRHAGAQRGDPARQDHPLLLPRHDRAGAVRAGGQVPVPRAAQGSIFVLVGVSVLYVLWRWGSGS
ncbi:MAG: hypothetical protein WDM92_11320 [Caulobacteraceae bacterium]